MTDTKNIENEILEFQNSIQQSERPEKYVKEEFLANINLVSQISELMENVENWDYYQANLILLDSMYLNDATFLYILPKLLPQIVENRGFLKGIRIRIEKMNIALFPEEYQDAIAKLYYHLQQFEAEKDGEQNEEVIKIL